MGVYHQIGHNSINLVYEEGLSQFDGIVCSPLNYTDAQVRLQIEQLPMSSFAIFDPHLYYPNSERGHLPEWEYYPSDFDTADQNSIKWWASLCNVLSRELLKRWRKPCMLTVYGRK